VRRIHRLLTEEGYTVRGVQKLLREKSEVEAAPIPHPAPSVFQPPADEPTAGVDVFRLIAIRNRLAEALDL
jgi:hypothetical protein